ncbi:MAG: CPBP family intramembrane glutamic endopeptidase [Thermoplasmatales archaeon]
MKIKISLLIPFLVFFVTEYLFIFFNIMFLYYIGLTAGLLSIPISFYSSKNEMKEDMKSSVVSIALLLTTFTLVLVFFSVFNKAWAVTLPELLVTPVLLEEFNFRYILQRILLRGIRRYDALILQAVVYVAYYSRYVTADHGAGFPFPYNMLMLSSVFSMGIVYGLLAMRTKSFLASTILHFLIWSMFPLLAHYPALASVLVPT